MRIHVVILIFLCITSISILPAFSQNYSLKFQHIGTQDGLSQSNVRCMIQDQQGFMWFGTRYGLNKYDGYRFTVYKHSYEENSISSNSVTALVEDTEGKLWIATWGGGVNVFDPEKERFIHYTAVPDDTVSLSDNFVNSIYEDHQGVIWVGTKYGGLNCFDRCTNTFKNFTHEKSDTNSISSNAVYDIYEDRHHNLWVGTETGGLNLFDREKQTFTRFEHDPDNPTSISHNYVQAIFEDSRGHLWLGTYGGGLNLLDTEKKTFQHYKKEENNPNSLSHNFIMSLHEDEEGNLWIGTENHGLNIFNFATASFTHHKQNKADPTSLSNNSVWSILKDRKGNMWVGTYSGGINFFNTDNKIMHHYRHNTSSNSLSDNSVLSFFEDSDQQIWIGTDGGGLNLFDPSTKHFTRYIHDEKNKNSIGGNYVLGIHEDKDKNIWIGTWGDGVTVMNRHTNEFRHFRHDPSDSNSLSSNNVWSVLVDRDQHVWMGTYFGGLNVYNPKTKRFTHYKYDPLDSSSISSNNIYVIFQDLKGHLWLGTDGGGLNLLDKNTGKFTRFLHTEGKNSISNNTVSCIYEDTNGFLWISTDAGLNKFDPVSQQFTMYTEREGLPNDRVFGILEDDQKNLWLSTNRGLSKFNPGTLTFKNYSVADGLQHDEFARQAFCKSRSGWMYFGGNNGFNEFHPEQVREKPYNPPLVFTGFQLFNKEVSIDKYPNDPTSLSKHISYLHEIVLSYTQSVITVEFASLNYTVEAKKKYAYKLEGFDRDWQEIGHKRSLTFTNLDPGKYSLKVKGLNNEGNWSDHRAQLNIIVTPPFWQTWWCKLLLLFLIGGSAFSWYTMRINNIHKQKAILEKQVRERTAELKKAKKQAEESARLKEAFLANMSHEIRTPINGILGFTRQLEKTKLDEVQQHYVNIIHKSADNLLVIINEILDFGKIEAGKMELESIPFDVNEVIKVAHQTLFYKAEEKGIAFEAHPLPLAHTILKGDPYRLNQVLLNLLNNAMKFTQEGSVVLRGKILEETPTQVTLQFSVTDTGIGIPQEKQALIFEEFMQAANSTTRQYGGTGLGLSICKNLVEMQQGYIWVESEAGKGSIFSFVLTYPKCLEPIAFTQDKEAIDFNSLGPIHVLVADDNEINILLARSILQSWGFSADTARNGNEAIALFQENHYDIILMDIQMPELNGIEATQRIRSLPDIQKASTPIIALTANAFKDNAEKYMKAGMNGYVSKPFQEEELYLKIAALVPKKDSSTEDSEAAIAAHSHQSAIQDMPSPTAASPDPTTFRVCNLAYLEELSSDNKEFIGEIIALFLQQVPLELERIKQAVRNGDMQEVQKIAHKMKPTVSMLGAEGMKLHLEQIETLASLENETTEIMHLHQALVEKNKVATEELQVFLRDT